MEGYVIHDLVEGTLEERRIDGNDGPFACHGHAGREGDRMLLGDPGVEHPVREALPHLHQPGGGNHRRRDAHQIRPGGGGLGNRLPGDVGEAQLGVERLACGQIEGAHPVELLQIVLDRRLVTVPLLGHHMDYHRLVIGLGRVESLLEQIHVVPIDLPGVFEIEGVEHRGRLQDLLHRVLESTGELISRLPDEGKPAKHPTQCSLGLLIARVEPVVGQSGQSGKSADRGRIRATVVVENDDETLRFGHRDVIEGLVGHSPGQGAIADDRHRVTGVFGEGVAKCVGQRRGGMAVLDEVVWRLLPARVPGEAAGVAEPVEVAHSAGEQLVHIGLMADVPDEPVAWRVE